MTYPFNMVCGVKQTLWQNGPGKFEYQAPGCLFVLCVEKGSGVVCSADESPVLAGAGQVVMCGNGLRVDLAPDAGVLGVCLQGFAAEKALALHCGALVLRSAHGGVFQLVERLCEDGAISAGERSQTAYQLICRVVQAADAGGGVSPLVSVAVAEIHARYNELFGVEELAENLMVSKSYLIRRFSREMGVSPGKYLTSVRVNHARQMLVKRAFTLEMVAALCGFAGANYLCKVFKKETGETPTDYRNRVAPDFDGEDMTRISDEMYLF